MLRPLYCCLLASCFVFFLSRVVSALTIWFCPFLFFVDIGAFYLYLSLMENNVGLLGLPHLALLGPWAFEGLSFIVFLLIPTRLVHWAFFPFPYFIGPIKAPPTPFLSLETGHLIVASSSILPMDQCVLFLVLYGYFFSLGIRVIIPLFCCYSLIFPFSFLNWIWAFVSILSKIDINNHIYSK